MFLPCLIIQSLSINIILKLLILAFLGVILYIFPIIYFKLIDIKTLKTIKKTD